MTEEYDYDFTDSSEDEEEMTIGDDDGIEMEEQGETSANSSPKEPGTLDCKVMTVEDLDREMNDAINSVALILRISPGMCRILLNKYNWNKESLLERMNREKLKKYPFVFKLDELNLSYFQVTEDSIAKFRSFLAEFPIQSIGKIRSLPLRRRRNYGFDVDIEDWKGFTQFVEDFGVEDVEIHSGILDDDDDEKLLRIPDDAADYLVNNHARFRTDRFVSDSVILNASVRCLDLRNASISQETFLSLLKKIATSTNDFVWKIGCEPFEFGHYDIFEAVDVFHDEDFDGPLPQNRPLVFYDKQEERCLQFCILIEDGKRIMCEDHGGCVVFCSSEEEDGLEDKYEEDLLVFL